MYTWKSWRDSRASFFALLILSSLLTFLWAAAVRLGIAETPEEMRPDLVVASVTAGSVFLMSPVAVLIGLVLGSKGIGVDLGKPSAEFLFTRPVSRWRLLCSNYGVGILEILVLVAFTAALTIVMTSGRIAAVWYCGVARSCAATMLSPGTRIYPVLLFISYLLIALGTYFLTQLIAIITRDGRRAFGISAGLILTFWFGTLAFTRFTAIEVPSLTGFTIHNFDTHSSEISYAAPIFPLIACAVFGLLAIWAASLLLNRAEI
jgi:hypothetical protein